MTSQTSEMGEKKSLFKDKVVVCKDSLDEVTTDAIVSFCTPSIADGPLVKQLQDMAGSELEAACSNYKGMCPTSSRVTPAFEAKNFKWIVHTLVPEAVNLAKPIDIRKFYLCVRNSLDAAAETGAKSIGIPSYFPGVDTTATCEIVLRIFTVWIHCSPYSDQITEIKVVCSSDEDFQLYVEAARTLYSQASVVGQSLVANFMQIDAAGGGRQNQGVARGGRGRCRRPLYDQQPVQQSYAAPVKLELSAKLAPTILVIDDENGNKRQYRLTNKSRDGRKLYFRCSRCDTLIKKDGQRIRAKLIVQDGVIVSDQYPEHHPDCEAKTQEDIFVQQVDRSSRRDVKDGRYLPQDAYKIAVNRVLAESEIDPNFAGAVEKFPDWPRLRQQYCRIRKTALGKRYRHDDVDEGDPHQPRYSTRSHRPRRNYSPTYSGGPTASGTSTRMTTRRLHQQQEEEDEQGGAHQGHDGHGAMMVDDPYGQLPHHSRRDEMGGDPTGVQMMGEHGVEVETMGEVEDMDAYVNVDDDVTVTTIHNSTGNGSSGGGDAGTIASAAT